MRRVQVLSCNDRNLHTPTISQLPVLYSHCIIYNILLEHKSVAPREIFL